MPGRSTTEMIFLRHQLIKRYREQNDLHVVFIDLEKAYDKDGHVVDAREA